MKIAYLGPAGTFTEQAAFYYNAPGDRIMYATIDDVLQAVLNDEADTAVVPVENSTEGAVNAADALTMIARKTSYLRVVGSYHTVFCNRQDSLV